MKAELDRPAAGLSLASGQDSAGQRGGPDAELIAALRSLRELGRFEHAAALVRDADEGPAARQLSAHAHAAAGPALAAVSQYPAAAVHLLLASMEPTLAPTALGQLAEIAWIEHDHPRGRAFALAGLSLDPSNRKCRVQLQRNENDRALPRATDSDRGGLSHAAFFADAQGNAGDRVLTDAVRRCFTGASALGRAAAGAADAATGEGTGRSGWQDVHVHQLFDERRLAEVNGTEGLIVGGGGLFLPDTAPNGNSGWQWNVSDQTLTRITVPLVVFAVGYNMFEGQSFQLDGANAAESRFAQSLRTLVECSTFIGLRNHGSVDRVRELLPDRLAERIGWQPCPTAITDLLADPPGFGSPVAAPDPAGTNLDPAEDDPVPPGAVLLNCAYDRAGRRFGDGYGAFLAHLRDWVVATREQAEVRYAAHCVADERFVSDLRREHGITLPMIAMYDLTSAQIHQHYRQARLVVGMRGHAGMIPFGCGTPIISLISHPKLGYFLDDIDRPQWGIGVRDPHLADRLRELTTELLDDGPAVAADIAAIQRRLAIVTARNLSSLPAPLQPTHHIGQDQTSE